ncbi:hypothetical protein BGZ60DRAFT_212855 [Tricladium varicosporioides]|nr:hypothetical protein BGZ60DRAFT_212855 [Hymenoscyphus varicosporioides]
MSFCPVVGKGGDNPKIVVLAYFDAKTPLQDLSIKQTKPGYNFIFIPYLILHFSLVVTISQSTSVLYHSIVYADPITIQHANVVTSHSLCFSASSLPLKSNFSNTFVTVVCSRKTQQCFNYFFGFGPNSSHTYIVPESPDCRGSWQGGYEHMSWSSFISSPRAIAMINIG